MVMAPLGNSVQFRPPPVDTIAAFRSQVNTVIAKLPPDQQDALVLVGSKVRTPLDEDDHGETVQYNAALVTRREGQWTVRLWVAKRWGEPYDGCAALMQSW